MRLASLLLSPILSIAALPSLSTGAAADDDDIAARRSITVSATGTVAVEPDQAQISSGVTTQAATAKEALAANSAAMQKVIAGLKQAGIDAKDIQTSSLHVNPRYTRPKEGETPQIDGYTVTNQIAITARDLDNLGEVLDKLVSLGANEMGGLTFRVSQAETLRDDARKDAVANAKRRAELYATAAGVQLGEVLRIDEGRESGPPPMPMARTMKMSAVPIERGTETLSVSVRITWALQ
jgi:uncharacterized protein YggE